jgi:hypothetical protein
MKKLRKDNTSVPIPEQLAAARKRFKEMEPRYLFYPIATKMVQAALKQQTADTLAEAIHVLLLTWNFRYYQARPINLRYRHKFHAALEANRNLIRRYRRRSIQSFSSNDELELMRMFREFGRILGPVGAAKALNLLAPRFFPLWDNGIARLYGIWLNQKSSKKKGIWWPSYAAFMRIRQSQCQYVREHDPLKALDEWDYTQAHDKRRRRTR